MKFRITLKDPDGVWQSLEEESIDPDNADNRDSEVNSVIERFIEYGEYVTIELDTETCSAIVVPN